MALTKGQIVFDGDYTQHELAESREASEEDNESTHDLTVGVSSLDRTSSDSEKPATLQSGFYQDKKKFEKLEKMVEHSQDVLFRAYTVFPFDLFPDCLCIDENKVSIISKTFMGTEHVRSVLIGDITDVTVQTTPFLSTLEIVDSSNVRNPIYIKIDNLKTKDAVRARRIIQGLIAVKQEKADISGLEHRELVKKLEKLGEAKGGE